jgi:mannose/cellobiose epimerase-like protein (N-acyl-D-glucosamine 2-epimerase family)
MAITVCVLGSAMLIAQVRPTVKPLARLPQAEVSKHVDRAWIKEMITKGTLEYWVKHSVEPNGFIQENLDRQWKPWGTQREASINGQGRMLFALALGYEMTRSKEYLDALNRGMDFLMKMRDPMYGGYYDRVAPDFRVINDNKTGFSSFALQSLATAGRVTGDKRYLDAAMVFFREVRDKMRDGPFLSSSMQRDFMKPSAGRGFGGAGAGRGPAGAPGAPPAAAGPPIAPAAPGAAAPTAGVRRHGINLHMFEALLTLYEATKSDEVWYEINQQLTAIDRLFNREIGYLPESYDEDWKPVGNPSGNPGHLFEWASLLSRAVELGADPKFIELGSRNLDLGLKSYNEAVGGLGGVNAAGQPTQMLWWPQCEVLKATAHYAILHGRTDLWPYYQKTWDLLKKEYIDTTDGGWFAAYVPGRPRADQGEKAFYKGSVDGPEWSAYHQTYASYEIWRISDPAYKPWPRKQ